MSLHVASPFMPRSWAIGLPQQVKHYPGPLSARTDATECRPERCERPRLGILGQRATCIVAAVPWDDPFVRLSDHIVLTPAEAAQLLEVLDIAVATAGTEEERVAVR